eukprot:832126_1
MESILQVVDVIGCIPKRKCFKLRLNTTNRNDTRSRDEHLRELCLGELRVVWALSTALEMLVTKDFMLFMEFRLDTLFAEKIHNETKIMKESEDNYRTFYKRNTSSVRCYVDEAEGVYEEEEFEQVTFAVCNKNNNMGGYKFTQTWNMPCTHFDDIA